MKIKLFITTLFFSVLSWGQGTESFSNLNASGASYSNGAYVGDNGVTWAYNQARLVTSVDNITGNSIGFSDTGSRNVSCNSGSAGVGTLNYSARSYFTSGTAANRIFEVYVNSVLVETFSLSAMNTVYNRSISVNVSGNVIIEFRCIGSKQIVLDNVSWTSGCIPPTNPTGVINVSPSCSSSTLSYSLPSTTSYWQNSATGISTVNPSTSPLIINASGTYFIRSYSGVCWSTGSISQTVTISNPILISTQPTNQSTTVGSTASFNVLATNTTSYQWQLSTDNESSWSNVGTNSSSYTTPSATLSMNGYKYRVVVSGNSPCTNVTSAVATLNVTTGPCLGENFTSATFPPLGWIATGTSRSTSTSDYNSSPAAVSFNSNNGELTTTMISYPTQLRFNLGRSSSSTDKTLTVEVSTTSQTTGFAVVATYDHSNVPSSSYDQYIINLASYTNNANVWIRFVKSSTTTSPWRLDDMQVFCGTPCTPPTIASVFPLNGSVGTHITISASSGSLLGATATLSGIPMTVISSNATQLVVKVPTGASTTSGNLVITDGQPCNTSATFTFNKKSGSCGTFSDLIMSEIYDSPSGSLGYIEIYNGTGAVVDLTNYFIRRYGDNADLIANNFTDFTFAPSITSVANGAVIYGRISSDVNVATPSFDYGNSSGINGNDILHLYNGSTLIDVYVIPNNTAGYTALRKLTTSGPNTTSNPSDWTHTNSQSISDLGLFPFVPSGGSPFINTNPSSVSNCSNSVSFSVLATASGTGTLSYQWYYNNMANTNWTIVNATSFPSVTTPGFSSNTLNLTGNIISINGYQFYCLVTQDGSCSLFSDSAQLKIPTTIWNGVTWSNGVPTISSFAILNGNYNTSVHGDIDACSLTINDGFSAVINADRYFNIQNNLTVNGTLDILNNGSLVQINDSGINTGNITYERIASVKRKDYVYWSSPVDGFGVNSISPLTPASLHWLWNPTALNSNGGQGNWQNASSIMLAGNGYIVRAPNGFSNTVNQNWTAIFNNGIARNGIYNVAISRGSDLGAGTAGPNGILRTIEDDNWNLLGNPYPSSLNIISFLSANSDIDGFIRLWTHGTPPSNTAADPFYGNYVYNYSAGDYIALNGSGATSGPSAPGVVGSGQGFFVLMNSGSAGTGNVNFNNSMRSKNYSNSHFYRTSSDVVEKSRIWLDLISSNNETTRTLVAYVDGATNTRDRLYDAVTSVSSAQNFYSLIDSNLFTIQGKSLPFTKTDEVSLGLKVNSNGLYTIAIGAVDGLFVSNQEVFIEDKEMNIIHNLSQTPYSFNINSGTNNNRFVLRYVDSRLGNDNFENNSDVFVVSSNTISIVSSVELISKVVINDVLGREILKQDNIMSNNFEISRLMKTNSALFIKVRLTNGNLIIKKVIY